MRRLLTAYDVAKTLRCSYRYVHILRKKGLLRAVALGGVWRFDPADVEAYVEQQKATARHAISGAGSGSSGPPPT